MTLKQMVISIMRKNYLNLRDIRLIILLTIFVISGFYFQNAYAYIDPGSGSVVIQMIVGALVGIGITLKLYWYKFKEKILRITKKDDKLCSNEKALSKVKGIVTEDYFNKHFKLG